ncbi:MAG: translesion DNA synthesis-associated protein ImuA [Betaproteobacteria bacterium]|nr:translesion DNA synthesis-associated protein ImuA [Betaproteobacteria bacterium]
MMSLESLLQRQDLWRGTPPATGASAVATGFADLDRELPGGGWPSGALSEVLSGTEGIGELQLVLPAIARLTASGQRVAWLAPPHLPYAPALAAAGVALDRLTVVRAPGRRDALWAVEQALRSRAFHALLAWPQRPGYPELRRLAVAAEGGAAFVVLFRPLAAAEEASPARLRLALEPAGEQVRIHVLKRRGAPVRAPLQFHIGRPVHAVGSPVPPWDRVAGARARACAA